MRVELLAVIGMKRLKRDAVRRKLQDIGGTQAEHIDLLDKMTHRWGVVVEPGTHV